LIEPASKHDQRLQAEGFDPWPLVRFAVALPVFFALCLFLPAGTWAWQRGWLFVLVFIVTMVLSAVALWLVNPDIYVARSRIRKDTKRWDKILLPFILLAMGAILPVAALDDGRFHWFPTAWWVVALGYFLCLAGFALTAWAQAVNRFFEPTVRIQTDRGHKVIDSGPYAFVRHPGYVAAMVMFAGLALSLGSLWALIPAGIASALLVLRTRWEDDTLQAELPGYNEYSQRVRRRLMAGIW
jgi:protein-S-isoprenylcysteine O-methyltransferase Ste14